MTTTPDGYPLVDVTLARRLERAEGASSARSCEASARAVPGRRAEWIAVNGTYAMFDGPESPITQTFGFGMFAVPLLDARLRYAAENGCDLALMVARPGSGSQRNAERHGFRIAYTRLKWRKRNTNPSPVTGEPRA